MTGSPSPPAGAPQPVLVAGSYPPIPVAGAAATVAEVRRSWAAGDEVVVVSPRLSAAHLAVPVAGVLAGRRLDNVRTVTGTDRLVMVVETGFPVPAGPAALQVATVALLIPALRRFRHVRLVRTAGSDIPPALWSRLAATASEVAEAPAGPAATGVTPLGPPEVPARELPLRVAGTLARRLLGSRAPALRARAGQVRRAAGRLLDR